MRDPCRVQVTGTLAEHAEGFRVELVAKGYVREAAARQLRLMADVSGWLSARGMEASELAAPALVDQLLQARRAEGAKILLSRRALRPLIDYLESQGVVPATLVVTSSPTEALIEEYRRCLRDERGLSKSTACQYLSTARLFLSELGHLEDGADLQQMTAEQVSGFVVEQCRRQRPASAKVLVTGLRSLLRFLFASHYTSHQLSGAVPTPRGFSGGPLPRSLDDGEVAVLLESCDRSTARGRRDFAVLTVLSRLCLRSFEVAALQLDDLDWHRGEIVVQGKGRRRELMPLPADVGEALVAYLSDGRPQVECRALFLRTHAPISGLTSAGVGTVVRSACRRAGIAPVGAHRLRHHGATAMLQRGATLSEVGQALRHVHAATTSIYAKVDRIALRALAQPWPGGVR